MIALAHTSDAIILQRMPAWARFIDWVILDKLCVLTQHRYCNHQATRWLRTLVEAHTEEFHVMTTTDTIPAFRSWMNWSTDADSDPSWDGFE